MAELKIDELNMLKELRAFRAGDFGKVSIGNADLFRKLGILSKAAVENAMYEWFSPMGITNSDIERRVKLACCFEDSFIEMLIIFSMEETPDYEQMEQRFFESYGNAIEKFASEDKRLNVSNLVDRKFDFSEDVTESTKKGVPNPYSEERAITMAVTESSVALDSEDFREAIVKGYTHKRWNTIIDGKEREWHYDADGQTVPIDEYFVVDGELMRYPHDPNASARNLCNCRCWADYS